MIAHENRARKWLDFTSFASYFKLLIFEQIKISLLFFSLEYETMFLRFTKIVLNYM